MRTLWKSQWPTRSGEMQSEWWGHSENLSGRPGLERCRANDEDTLKISVADQVWRDAERMMRTLWKSQWPTRSGEMQSEWWGHSENLSGRPGLERCRANDEDTLKISVADQVWRDADRIMGTLWKSQWPTRSGEMQSEWWGHPENLSGRPGLERCRANDEDTLKISVADQVWRDAERMMRTLWKSQWPTRSGKMQSEWWGHTENLSGRPGLERCRSNNGDTLKISVADQVWRDAERMMRTHWKSQWQTRSGEMQSEWWGHSENLSGRPGLERCWAND